MTSDPRFKNQIFEGSTPGDYLNRYMEALSHALKSVSHQSLQTAYDLITDALQTGGTVYVAGNGGSAAISEHLCCDWSKGTWVVGRNHLHVHSLCSNTPLVTAISNDYGYDLVFSTQLKMLGKPGDVLVLISSSGNSPNIVNALDKAQEMGIKTIGLSGFSGGVLSQKADVNLYVEFSNYGVVEDCHQILMHVLAQFLTTVRDQTGSNL